MALAPLHPIDLSSREALHRSIVQESPSPIFLVDVESRRIIDANPATSTLLMYSLEELLELDLYNVDLARRSEQDEIVQNVVRRHHDIWGERAFRRRDGSTVMVEVSVNLVIFGGRQVLCFFARDITERQEAARERDRLHRQLFLSQKHEAVGRLAAGIAHDFNNHLMVMMLCGQLVQGRLDPSDESATDLEELATAGHRAATLVRQLLAFSGKQRLRPRLVKLDDVLHGLEKMLRRIVGEDIALVVEYGTTDGTVRADSTQLEQVILNLVVNGRDALPAHGTLTISVDQVDVGDDFVSDYATLSTGPHVRLRVSDNGKGMDENTLSHIFEPFFTTKEVGKGTGLGLTTVYGIVKQSGGSIWATSKVGEGTTFFVYLPVADPDQDEAAGVGYALETEDEPIGVETIMVVEDEDMVRVLTARILRDLGYSVVEMPDAVDALEFIEGKAAAGQDLPHLVLTDVVMPRMSGRDFVEVASKKYPGMTFMLMSGYAQAVGADDKPERFLMLEKPLTRATLSHAVRRALDSH